MANKPLETLSYPAGNGSSIQISVWENENKKDRQTFVTYAVTVQRRYRDGDGDQAEWKSSDSLRPSDLLTAAHGLTRAFEIISNLKEKR